MKIFRQEIPVSSRNELEEHLSANGGEIKARIKWWEPTCVEQGEDFAQAGVKEVVKKGVYFKGQQEDGTECIVFHPNGLRPPILPHECMPPFFLQPEDELAVQGTSVVVMLRRERSEAEEAALRANQPVAW